MISFTFPFSQQSHENQWLECAQKLTDMIQQIIEFAKMVPGFMKLSQDDQIVLLKAGTVLGLGPVDDKNYLIV